jgi:pimeloyl-ACP methyl ester carboxylesterase
MIRDVRISINGRSTRYLEAGAGWPLILLHAFPLNADMWRPQLERVPTGWRMIAPDFRGFGPAAQSADDGSGSGGEAKHPEPQQGSTRDALTLDDLAGDIDALMDALEIAEAVIGGLSMGGYVAFALTRTSPSRFTGMVLADTRAPADTAEGREGRRKMIEMVRAHGPGAVADQMLPRLLGPTTQKTRPEVTTSVRQMIESASADGIASAVQAMLTRPDSTPDLARISWPVLIMVGGEDGITPVTDAEEMNRGVARSRVVVLPAAGHLSNLEAPEAFSRALEDFLLSNM